MMKSKVTITTDFHTHLLPDVDCSGNPDIACQLINNMKEAGIENIVLTPHFYPQRNSSVPEFIAKRNSKIDILLKKMEETGIKEVNIIPAAEVLLCPGLDHLEDLRLLCIEGTSTLLVEMPDLPWNEGLLDTLSSIRDLNIDVIIAHADRYGNKESEKLIAMGFGVQLNADSLCAFSGKKSLLNWANQGYVLALGSDKHVHNDRSTPVYKDFVKASAVLSDRAEIINNSMLELIGKA